MSDKLRLYGFNNLTKSLSFNIYDVCYAKTEREQRDYIAYIDRQYNSERLKKILTDVTQMIGATVLNISGQDYEPQGSSVAILIAEGDVTTPPGAEEKPENMQSRHLKAGGIQETGTQGVGLQSAGLQEAGLQSAGIQEAGLQSAGTQGVGTQGVGTQNDAVWSARLQGAGMPGVGAQGTGMPGNGAGADEVPNRLMMAHLDKSHITVHTYPEYHPDTCLATFRVDIDVSTCGEITPLSTLDYLIGSFDSDIITMDYRVRGFTRDLSGKKLFMDHTITSIQDYINPKTLERYDAVDINVYEANLFHTKMLIKDIDLQNYLFNSDVYELPPRTRLEITDSLRREMIEIFSERNIY